MSDEGRLWRPFFMEKSINDNGHKIQVSQVRAQAKKYCADDLPIRDIRFWDNRLGKYAVDESQVRSFCKKVNFKYP
jgi:hypothetical protein